MDYPVSDRKKEANHPRSMAEIPQSTKAPIARQMTTLTKPPAGKRKLKNKPYLRSTKVNWVEVGRQFVNGIVVQDGEPKGTRRWPPLAELARSFKVSETMIYLRAREGSWAAQREAFQRDLRAEEDKRLIQELADLRARSQVAFVATALRIQAHVARRLQDPTLDDMALQRLATSLRTAQQVIEVSMGKPADGPANVHPDWTLFTAPVSAPVLEVLAALDDIDTPEMGGVVSPPRERG